MLASNRSNIESFCIETWLNPLNVKSCNYTSKRNWQELISARAIINRLGAHFLAPADNGELGLIFHELIMIGMLSSDSGQYREDNEDFWTHVLGYKLKQEGSDKAGYFACNALMPFSNQ